MAEVLEAESVRITRHATDRYMQRRGWKPERREEAIRKIQDLLQRVDGKQAPAKLRPDGSCARRIVRGEMVMVFSEDYGTLITFYERRPTPRSSNRGRGRN